MGAPHTKDLSGPCYVYVLVDPRSRKPFYIGISHNPWDRFYNHLHDPCSAAWGRLRDLMEIGYVDEQIFKIYKRCRDRAAAFDLEYTLVNATSGLLNRCKTRQTHWAAAA